MQKADKEKIKEITGTLPWYESKEVISDISYLGGIDVVDESPGTRTKPSLQVWKYPKGLRIKVYPGGEVITLPLANEDFEFWALEKVRSIPKKSFSVLKHAMENFDLSGAGGTADEIMEEEYPKKNHFILTIGYKENGKKKAFLNFVKKKKMEKVKKFFRDNYIDKQLAGYELEEEE